MRLVRITASSWAPGDGCLRQPPRPAEKWHKKSTTKKNRQIRMLGELDRQGRGAITVRTAGCGAACVVQGSLQGTAISVNTLLPQSSTKVQCIFDSQCCSLVARNVADLHESSSESTRPRRQLFVTEVRESCKS